ncbi:MAG TPA: sugar transferase [Thermoanaerobaculia bacterium]|nr:sugar transferase [Thermoanaerobaculia bacterium]
MLKQHAKLVRRLVYLSDAALTAAAFFLAFWVRDLLLPIFLPTLFPTGLHPIEGYVKILPVVLIIWSLLFFSHQSYHSHRTVPMRRELLDVLHIVALGTLLLATIAYLVPLQILSRSWFALFALFSALLLCLNRMAIRLLARYVRLRGMNYRTLLVVGTGRRGREIVELIEQHPYWGYKIVGFVSDGHRLPNGWNGRHRVVGSIEDLRRLVEKGIEGQKDAIDEIVFAVTRRKLDAMRSVFLLCEELGVRTRVAMNFFPNRVARVELEELEGIPFLSFTTTPSNLTHLVLKRTIDVAVSAALLLFALPVIATASLAIRLTSQGSVLFRQERLGLNGRIFTLYKFRTMIEDAHRMRGEVAHLNEMNGPVFKTRYDPRVTPVGRILRKFSLDELPQLWNVLRGDMSLVGPRPPLPEEVWAYQRWQRRRLSMKPGLTCLWQVSGRNHVDFDRWMKLDLQYIDTWSPTLDFKILLRTIPAVLSGRGAS